MNKQIIKAKAKYQKIKKEQNQREKKITNSRIVVFFLFLISTIIYINTKIFILKIIMLLAILLFFTLVINHYLLRKKQEQIANYLKIIKEYEKRTTEEWTSSFLTEIEIEKEEDYLIDLDILGKNSLFTFLDFTISLGGRKKLHQTLTLEKVDYEEIMKKQEAITELKENFNFALSFEEKLSNIEHIKKIDFKEYLYLFNKKRNNKKYYYIGSITLSIITIILFLLSCFSIISSIYFTIFFLIQIIISYIYMYIYKEEFNKIAKCSRIFSKLKNIYNFLETENFTTDKNKEIQQNIRNGKEILNELTQIANLDSCRLNFISYIIGNVFFSLNFRILDKYNKLLQQEKETFARSITSLEEIETLISLTTIAYVKKEICLPTINKELIVKTIDIKHPLLQEEKCISNSFQCNNDINIITGSNMSGKTSFMRTMGINLVLAYAGTYVNAKEFDCPIMKIFTSINVKDDIKKGISTFYGELKRVKNILDFSKENNELMIIFIDEIFKGTNYNDRILGAKEVLKKLAELDCIVFLTTHDFELCEIKNKKINNYHFEEFYKENKIYFDYKIKEGKCTTTNARYLMKQMKIIDEK